MAPRWKGKDIEAKAHSKAKAIEHPMSRIVAALRLSLLKSDTVGWISGCFVLFGAYRELSKLLKHTGFGRPTSSYQNQKGKLLYELDLVEAFYLYYELECLKIMGYENASELWHCMSSRVEMFPEMYHVYGHLRLKNWVVKSGSQFGADFVAYEHSPSLVHSKYAVLIQSDSGNISNRRLKQWSDVYCRTRISSGVAKKLLVFHIQGNGGEIDFPKCLETFRVEERKISRWAQEKNERKIQANDLSIPQLSLTELSNCTGWILGCSVLIVANSEQSKFLNYACYGDIVPRYDDNGVRLYELGLEEAFYLCYGLNFLKIVGYDDDIEKLWHCMSSKLEMFPILYKAYSYLRMKNWVVKSGLQYGVDYVAYHHHPSLVHSEYAVIVESDASTRLHSWTDIQSATRLCIGVAKKLLHLHVQCCYDNKADPVESLKSMNVEERIISGWNPEKSREGELDDVKGPRWKGSHLEAKASAEPISAIQSCTLFCDFDNLTFTLN